MKQKAIDKILTGWALFTESFQLEAKENMCKLYRKKTSLWSLM